MTALVLPLAAVSRADVARVGGKAAALGTLLAAGFPIPPGLCVTTAAFRLAMHPFRKRIAEQLRAAGTGHRPNATTEAISVLLSSLTIPPAVMEALRTALPVVATGPAAMAVRSSATDEDGGKVSFAGQYETVLGVSGEAAIIEAILTCWRSFFSTHALVARAEAGMDGAETIADGAMAVLIQRMVEAECAGVCFTRDPVRPDREVVVVDAAWGLGAGVVDGSVATDTAWLLRDAPQRIDDRRIVEKAERVEIDPAGGIRRVAVAGDQRRAACLPEPWLRRVAEFGLVSEVLLGGPQDLEWAIAGDHVALLQSRPITTLTPHRSWTWNFPLTWEQDADRTTLWQLHDDDRDAVPTPLEIDVSDAFFQAQVDGLPISCWPGASRQRVLHGRRYIGHVPTRIPAGGRRLGDKAKGDLAIRLRTEGKTMWDHWSPEIKQAIARLAAFDATAAEPARVADHLEDAFGAFRRHWMIHWCLWAHDREAQPLAGAFIAMRGLGDDGWNTIEQALAPLVEGEETLLTRLIDGLYALAQTASATPAVATLVAARPADAWTQLTQRPDAAAFCEQMGAFLVLYGDHMGMGYGSTSSLQRLTWRQDPGQVLALLAPYLSPMVEAPAVARARARAERDNRVEQLCAACSDPTQVAAFRRWLPVARREATVLEEHNYWIDQVTYGQLRTAISAAAHLLVPRGSIAEEDDVFWLSVEEIVTALRGEPSQVQATLIIDRKAASETHRQFTPPPLLGLPKARLDPRPPLKDEVTAGAPEGATTLRGIGASAGRRRGRARIVPMTTVLPAVQPGEVLVSLNAGPSWTPIFPLLGGLVLDEGSYGQHGATTAREYHLPAVIGTRNATRRIPDGAWVVIDGETGTVDIEQ